MASVIYPKYKDAVYTGLSNVDLSGNNINISLIDTGVISYSANNEFYANLDANGVISTVTLIGNDFSNASFSAANTEFTSFSNDSVTCESVIVWINTGANTTSRLVAWLEDDAISGLPITGSSNVSIDFATSIFQV